MSDDAARRAALGELLRRARKSLRPIDVGLPDLPGRRVPGLRREEVAELAGASSDWYRAFERGRARRPSIDFIARVASALRLEDSMRRRLFALALPALGFDEYLADDGIPAEDFARLRAFLRRTKRHGSQELLVDAAETLFSKMRTDFGAVVMRYRRESDDYAVDAIAGSANAGPIPAAHVRSWRAFAHDGDVDAIEDIEVVRSLIDDEGSSDALPFAYLGVPIDMGDTDASLVTVAARHSTRFASADRQFARVVGDAVETILHR